MDYFSENLTLISKKWPELIDTLQASEFTSVDAQWLAGSSDTIIFKGIQQSSSYDASLEASLQCQHISENEPYIQAYGVGLGYAIEHLLLRKALQKLDVFIMNSELFSFALHHVDFTLWLGDERVNLCYPNNNSAIKRPFVALPGELAIAEEQLASIRDRVCLELDHQYISETNDGKSSAVIETIKKNKELIKQDGGINELIDFLRLSTSIERKELIYVIAAAGPSLSDHYQWIKQQKKKGNIVLIAVDAAVKPLLNVGTTPDIIVSIDKVASKLFEKVDMEELRQIPLVYFPLLENSFLKRWPGPRFVSLSSGSSFDEYAVLYNCFRLYCAGSVIHPSIDLAVKLSARKIIMLGADFSLIRNTTHVKDTQIVHKESVLSHNNTPYWLLNGRGEKVPTYLNFRGYLRDLEQYIIQHPEVKFFTGSLDGAAIHGTELWHEF